MKVLTILLVGVFTFLQYSLWFGDNGLIEFFRLKQTIAKQQDDNLALTQENAVLSAEVIDLQQGLDAIEERARNELGMIKRNETFYQIVE